MWLFPVWGVVMSGAGKSTSVQSCPATTHTHTAKHMFALLLENGGLEIVTGRGQFTVYFPNHKFVGASWNSYPFWELRGFAHYPLLTAVARPPAPCSYPLTHCISEFPGIITKYSKLWLIFFFKREVYLANIVESRSPALGDYTDSLWREPFHWVTSG